MLSLPFQVQWRQCPASQWPLGRVSRTSIRAAECYRRRATPAEWARWAWPLAWRSVRVPARVCSNATMAMPAECHGRRATSRCIWAMDRDRRAVRRNRTTLPAWISTITARIQPARLVSVYRTHCTRCLRFSQWTTTDFALRIQFR